MRARLAARLHDVPPTIFTTMSEIALRTDSVNLGQGFPDRDGPTGVLEDADEALRSRRNQ